jgi:hypothetical protein
VIDGLKALAARAWFALCLAAGRMVRSARYTEVRLEREGGQCFVGKHRRFYAPVLIWLSGPLVWILDGGVRVLPQREWEEYERRMYMSLRGTSIEVRAGGVLVLPRLAGRTLAEMLEDPQLATSTRKRAIEQATVALARFHRHGFTHADAMAENVMVDLDAGAAHWFDFETVHDESRPLRWRRADDVRALVTTCVLRTAPEQRAETVALIADAYADGDVARVLATIFASVWRRSLALHLAQAALPFRSFAEIGMVLRERASRLDT